MTVPPRNPPRAGGEGNREAWSVRAERGAKLGGGKSRGDCRGEPRASKLKPNQGKSKSIKPNQGKNPSLCTDRSVKSNPTEANRNQPKLLRSRNFFTPENPALLRHHPCNPGNAIFWISQILRCRIKFRVPDSVWLDLNRPKST